MCEHKNTYIDSGICVDCDTSKDEREAIKKRLACLREQIEQGNISYSGISELQRLSEHIDRGDVLLLEWAGVPEFN